jgi:CcmD family protein
MLTRLVFVLSVLVTLATAVTPAEAFQQPPDSMSEFKPISELPPTEKLPAAPFLISAYSIVWLIALFYIWTIWRRMNKLELEFRRLGSDRGQTPV